MEPSIIRVIHGKQIFKETIAMAALDKSVRKELGYPINSESGQSWFIYSGDVLFGFCSIINEGKSLHFCHDYVYPSYRKLGLYDKMFEYRLNYAKTFSLPITAVATNMSLNTYLRYGFKIEKQTKNYTWLILEVTNE